ncbi:MAG: hypothetical protein FAF05_00085 [Epsilonproteobacteria bacterium]|nr:hypothetical protein [Campylobacterota bacterium]
MKFFLLYISIVYTLTASDELARVESVVQEIELLRMNYETTSKQLSECEQKLNKNEKQNNNKDIYLINQINKLKEKIKREDAKIKELQSMIALNHTKTKKNKKIYLDKQINNFPHLQMRKGEVEHSKASAFRLKKRWTKAQTPMWIRAADVVTRETK